MPTITQAQYNTVMGVLNEIAGTSPPIQPPTSGGPTSPYGTTITPGVGSIIDASGYVWTISASGSVLRNGATPPEGAILNAIQAKFCPASGGRIFVEWSANQWVKDAITSWNSENPNC